MSIAEAAGRRRLTAARSCTTTRFWTRADAWAAELGLAGGDAGRGNRAPGRGLGR